MADKKKTEVSQEVQDKLRAFRDKLEAERRARSPLTPQRQADDEVASNSPIPDTPSAEEIDAWVGKLGEDAGEDNS